MRVFKIFSLSSFVSLLRGKMVFSYHWYLTVDLPCTWISVCWPKGHLYWPYYWLKGLSTIWKLISNPASHKTSPLSDTTNSITEIVGFTIFLVCTMMAGEAILDPSLGLRLKSPGIGQKRQGRGDRGQKRQGRWTRDMSRCWREGHKTSFLISGAETSRMRPFFSFPLEY